MTLIQIARTPYTVVQMSDRRLTWGGTGKVASEVANKSIFFVAKDAVVAVGYTGIAYIRNQPTDLWISKILADWDQDYIGRPFPTGSSAERRLQMYAEIPEPEIKKYQTNTINNIMRILAEQMQRHVKHDLILVVSGWRDLGKNFWCPLETTISKLGKRSQVQIAHRTKKITLKNYYKQIRKAHVELLNVPQAYIDKSSRKRVIENLTQATLYAGKRFPTFLSYATYIERILWG